ncbi:Y-family DNA polymerase [Mucilaginibacter aquariorum]|uniref:DNA polymerase Y family protein n=1 Tax=Mucilaginibacter aquariorum TaxID=2967225 RepID=A0ABT1T127_9SPHI|nr:DNA polymerase Y family protein [Mucilaginibacter aquariorum]MCQ6958294.1 DNA polymerase Y family protein [Mucilaginibacter aquariorum]
MPKRFASIWFRHLLTDQKAIRQPGLKGKAYVFAEPDHGRMLIMAVTDAARKYGVTEGMTVADARVIAPDLHVFDGKAGRNLKLLTALAEWFLRYTPLVQLDPPDGLLLDITGCTHLKGGEKAYLQEIVARLKAIGYDVRPAIADTIGAAWGVARCATSGLIVPVGEHRNALMPLPPSALRLAMDQLMKLRNLGMHQISSFIYMPNSVLRRRFGKNMVLRLHQALGQEVEYLFPIKEPVPYSERLECLEAIRTRPAIEIALNNLLERLCKRLYGEGLGLRSATLTWYRIDGKNGKITIGTNHASNRVQHLFKLFFNHLDTVAPGLGIELFTLDANKTEPISDKQSELWSAKGGVDSTEVAELLDRVAGRIGTAHINRYLPGEHYWPERTPQANADIKKAPESEWRTDKPRPMQILDKPEPIEAMALTPDYPPKLFIWKGEQHVIVGADGPERIEREWWLEPGEHRDYYVAEDEAGRRYWLFRSGHYNAENNQHWYLHGFFA